MVVVDSAFLKVIIFSLLWHSDESCTFAAYSRSEPSCEIIKASTRDSEMMLLR